VKHKKPEQNDPIQKNQKKEILKMEICPIVSTFCIFFIKTVLSASLLAFVLFIISWFFFFPEPEIKITKSFDSPIMMSYDIVIRNPSKMDIHQITMAIRFDENYPVSACYLDEPQYKTGFVLRHGFVSRLSVSVGDKKSERPLPNPFKSSGIHASTNILEPDSAATIYVNIDKTYNGPKEQIFPLNLKPAQSLKSNCYFISYKYKPLGIFSPISITREGFYDFDGNETKADNYGKVYKQTIIGPDDKSSTFALPVNKDNSTQ
jgi:hypothetical protein